MPFSTKLPGPVGFLAPSADGSLGFKGMLYAEGLPLNHSNRKGFIHIFSFVVCARFIQGNADVRCRPRRFCMVIPDSAHIPRFEVLLALQANR